VSLRAAENELAALRRNSADGEPFAGLQAALEAGALSLSTDVRRTRRLLPPDAAAETPLTRGDRARLGSRGDRSRNSDARGRAHDGDVVHLEIRKPREALPEEIVRT
jgi:hypothetical protein